MSFSLALAGAIVGRRRRWQMPMVWVIRLMGEHPFVNEGLALSVQRSSVRFEFNVDGSLKQAAVELIGRCFSSRAIRREISNAGGCALAAHLAKMAGICCTEFV